MGIQLATRDEFLEYFGTTEVGTDASERCSRALCGSIESPAEKCASPCGGEKGTGGRH
eukprot:gene34477-63564_t